MGDSSVIKFQRALLRRSVEEAVDLWFLGEENQQKAAYLVAKHLCTLTRTTKVSNDDLRLSIGEFFGTGGDLPPFTQFISVVKSRIQDNLATLQPPCELPPELNSRTSQLREILNSDILEVIQIPGETRTCTLLCLNADYLSSWRMDVLPQSIQQAFSQQRSLRPNGSRDPSGIDDGLLKHMAEAIFESEPIWLRVPARDLLSKLPSLRMSPDELCSRLGTHPYFDGAEVRQKRIGLNAKEIVRRCRDPNGTFPQLASDEHLDSAPPLVAARPSRTAASVPAAGSTVTRPGSRAAAAAAAAAATAAAGPSSRANLADRWRALQPSEDESEELQESSFASSSASSAVQAATNTHASAAAISVPASVAQSQQQSQHRMQGGEGSAQASMQTTAEASASAKCAAAGHVEPQEAHSPGTYAVHSGEDDYQAWLHSMAMPEVEADTNNLWQSADVPAAVAQGVNEHTAQSGQLSWYLSEQAGSSQAASAAAATAAVPACVKPHVPAAHSTGAGTQPPSALNDTASGSAAHAYAPPAIQPQHVSLLQHSLAAYNPLAERSPSSATAMSAHMHVASQLLRSMSHPPPAPAPGHASSLLTPSADINPPPVQEQQQQQTSYLDAAAMLPGTSSPMPQEQLPVCNYEQAVLELAAAMPQSLLELVQPVLPEPSPVDLRIAAVTVEQGRNVCIVYTSGQVATLHGTADAVSVEDALPALWRAMGNSCPSGNHMGHAQAIATAIYAQGSPSGSSVASASIACVSPPGSLLRVELQRGMDRHSITSLTYRVGIHTQGAAMLVLGQLQQLQSAALAKQHLASMPASHLTTVITSEMLQPETKNDSPTSLLCVGPPGSGKSSLLRDACWQLSERLGMRVVAVDSHGDLAGHSDVPAAALGQRVHVLRPGTGADQAGCILQAGRLHGTQVVVVDEVSTSQDVEAVALLQQRGVHVVAGAAAASAQALLLSPVLWQLLLPTHAIEQSQFSAMVEMVSHDRCLVYEQSPAASAAPQLAGARSSAGAGRLGAYAPTHAVSPLTWPAQLRSFTEEGRVTIQQIRSGVRST